MHLPKILRRKADEQHSQSPSVTRTVRDQGENLVLFIHGLSGSTATTWAHMLKVFDSDADLLDYSYGCYQYPTTLFRLPFTKRMAGIPQIASGLRTHIQHHFPDKKRIMLVGHSLGGIVARHYILDELKSRTKINVSGLVLYATPHTGSSLANIGSTLSFWHRHLKQLSIGSETLNSINVDWVRTEAEKHIPTIYIVGGADAVVTEQSAAPYIGCDNIKTLIECGHLDIIEPHGLSDTRYKILKDFLLESMPNKAAKPELNSWRASDRGDVLFDIYYTASEPYYLKRPIDESISLAAKTSNVWVSGPAGVGKTAALRRMVIQSHWELHHVLLDGYQNLDPVDLLREVGNALCARADLPQLETDRRLAPYELYNHFRPALLKLSSGGPIALLIEEIPLPPGNLYTQFLELAYQLTQKSETDTTHNRIVWVFSSIRKPLSDLHNCRDKFLERIQFVDFELWSNDDLRTLVDLISDTLQLGLSSEQRKLIVLNANGSPRFVKHLLRRIRQEATRKMPLSEVINSVAMDIGQR